ncbi:MAG: macro domain-containing protein [Nitrososphaeraceae archaeon]|nr:macro domain-containing protein [Nitrososphaeraceae archaeon]MBV9666586.1 macro domain-containing protein [Nitrososphaeraceae archaeon]
MSIISELSVDNKKIISLVKGDITERNVDAIVNAANSYLKHGGGVAAAIVRKGGYIIQQESSKIGFVPVGSAVITTAGKLPCRAVIHAVGPRMGQGNEDNKLRKAVQSCLILATEKGFKSISMPAISSGIFGFPKDRCAKILLEESKTFLESNKKTSIQLIEFCIFDDETLGYFKSEFHDSIQL